MRFCFRILVLPEIWLSKNNYWNFKISELFHEYYVEKMKISIMYAYEILSAELNKIKFGKYLVLDKRSKIYPS